MVGALQQAFALGLQQMQLADAAMHRLEAWESDPAASDLCVKVCHHRVMMPRKQASPVARVMKQHTQSSQALMKSLLGWSASE